MIVLGRDIPGRRNAMYEAGTLFTYLGTSKIREPELNERGEEWL